MAAWSELLKVRRDYAVLADNVRENFSHRFWYAKGGYLYDVIDTQNGPDASIRPNQIMAVSLDSPLLARKQAAAVVETVRRELLTPVGLRSLNRDHASYRKQYKGSPWERDSAYHQGTAWAWWIGPFIDASLKVSGTPEGVQILQHLFEQLKVYGVGTIGEIFDAEPPHQPRGCVAQAWSVAELLRSYLNLRDRIRAKPDSAIETPGALPR
jgi:glycogen debranching enzyme